MKINIEVAENCSGWIQAISSRFMHGYPVQVSKYAQENSWILDQYSRLILLGRLTVRDLDYGKQEIFRKLADLAGELD